MKSPRIEITRILTITQQVSLDSYEDGWTVEQAMAYELNQDDTEQIQAVVEAVEMSGPEDDIDIKTIVSPVD